LKEVQLTRTSEELQQLLKKERIVELDQDIRSLSRSQLKKHFASKSGRIVLSRVIKSIIWQVYKRLSTVEDRGIIGNLRTFWYRHVKIVVSRIPKSHLGKSNAYDAMTKLFSEMVCEHRLFRYEDFDFTDENWENRRIGTTRPNVLVFSEKSGWVRVLREYHEKYGVSTMALGGFPSTLSSEYTARDILKELNPEQSVHLIGIVDYDYSGDLIAHSFKNQLQMMGLSIAGMELLIKPSHFSEEELSWFSFPLPKREPTKLRNWLEKTGGIGGKALGLESEAMPLDRLEVLLESALSRVTL
jgi:hypothetical protein